LLTQQRHQLAFKRWKIRSDGVPHGDHVDIGVTVAERVSRAISQGPRHFRMRGNKGWIMLLDIPRSFPQNLKVANDSVLRAGARQQASPG
jgi:hypothetical protein